MSVVLYISLAVVSNKVSNKDRHSFSQSFIQSFIHFCSAWRKLKVAQDVKGVLSATQCKLTIFLFNRKKSSWGGNERIRERGE